MSTTGEPRDQHPRLAPPTPRRGGRGLLRALAGGVVLAGVLTPAAALADEPVGWEQVQPVSGLQFFLVLLVAPVALAAIIWLLVVVPSWLRGNSYETGQVWAGDDEWFGGPKDGLERKADQAQIEAAGEQGGAGARY